MNTAPQIAHETSPESPVSKFRSSPTEGAKGGNVRTATTLWLMSAGALVVSAFLGPLVFLGIALLVLGSLTSLVILFTGVPNFYRKGACPHCATEVKIMSSSKDGVSCPGCKHRLVLRDERICDVTA